MLTPEDLFVAHLRKMDHTKRKTPGRIPRSEVYAEYLSFMKERNIERLAVTRNKLYAVLRLYFRPIKYNGIEMFDMS